MALVRFGIQVRMKITLPLRCKTIRARILASDWPLALVVWVRARIVWDCLAMISPVVSCTAVHFLLRSEKRSSELRLINIDNQLLRRIKRAMWRARLECGWFWINSSVNHALHGPFDSFARAFRCSVRLSRVGFTHTYPPKHPGQPALTLRMHARITLQRYVRVPFGHNIWK